MKHKIQPDRYISREIYNLASGANREYLERFIGMFTKIIKEKAIEVCTDISSDSDKSFDRGYVKGLHEAVELIVNSYRKGERLHYGKETHKDSGPKKF